MVPHEVLDLVEKTMATVERVRSACQGVKDLSPSGPDSEAAALEGALGPATKGTPDALRDAASRAGAARDAAARLGAPAAACASALAELAGVDAASLGKLASSGLGDVDAGALVGAYREGLTVVDEARETAEHLRELEERARTMEGEARAAAEAELAQARALEARGKEKISSARHAVERWIAEWIRRGHLAEEQLREMLDHLVESLGIAEKSEILKQLFAALREAVRVGADGHATIDPKQVIARLHALVDADGLRKRIRRALIGSSSSPWDAELSPGIPKLQTNDVRLAGHLLAGYSTDDLGILLHATASDYDLVGQATTQTSHYGADLGFHWVSGGPEAPLRLELRASGAFHAYDTVFVTLPAALAGKSLSSYDSYMGRGAAHVGARWMPSDRLFLRINAGGGVQYEVHDTAHVEGELSSQSSDKVSAHGTFSFDLDWRMWPHKLGLRVRAHGNDFLIQRDEVLLAPRVGATAVATEESQLELGGHAFLDFDALNIAGFVFAAWGGVDYVLVQGTPNGALGTVTPVVGIGVVRR